MLLPLLLVSLSQCSLAFTIIFSSIPARFSVAWQRHPVFQSWWENHCTLHCVQNKDDHDADIDPMLHTEEESKEKGSPKPTWELSPSFAAYVEQVRAEMGHIFLSNDADDAHAGSTGQGVACPGEPSVDPSRQIRANQGDSEWIDDW